jgi:hypothetical protein
MLKKKETSKALRKTVIYDKNGPKIMIFLNEKEKNSKSRIFCFAPLEYQLNLPK